MFQWISKIKAFVAYRLPNGISAHYFTGSLHVIRDLSEVNDEGVLFHSFDGSQLFFIDCLTSVDPETVDLSLQQTAQTETNRDEYNETFHQFKAAISDGTIQKAILSRTKSVPCSKDPILLFRDLNENYPATFNYLMHLPGTGTWMGATPELLLDIKDGRLTTMAVAGTKSNQVPTEWTEKEKEEHQYVTTDIVKKLSPFSSDITAKGPATYSAGPVDHLKTDISAWISSVYSWKAIVSVLHPTPAICGTPTDAAQKLILATEKHNRKFYTGYIGIIGEQRQLFFVNLRCMELFEDMAMLYLGGGITAPSVLEDEWMETENKAKTLLRVLEV